MVESSDNSSVSSLSRPGQPVMQRMPAQVQQALLASLARIDGLARRLDVAFTTPPADGSLAATAMAAALDHLRAWRTLLKAGVMPSYAHMSLLRTAHESALLAYWLVEPGLDPDTRRARGIAAQRDDYEERRKFEASAGVTTPPSEGKLAEGRLADLMKEARRLGLTQVSKKRQVLLKS